MFYFSHTESAEQKSSLSGIFFSNMRIDSLGWFYMLCICSIRLAYLLIWFQKQKKEKNNKQSMDVRVSSWGFQPDSHVGTKEKDRQTTPEKEMVVKQQQRTSEDSNDIRHLLLIQFCWDLLFDVVCICVCANLFSHKIARKISYAHRFYVCLCVCANVSFIQTIKIKNNFIWSTLLAHYFVSFLFCLLLFFYF